MLQVPPELKPLFESYLIQHRWLSPDELQHFSAYCAPNYPLENVLLSHQKISEKDLHLIINEVEHHAYDGLTQKIQFEGVSEKTYSSLKVFAPNDNKPAPKKFGPYEVLEKLAQGGMGMIYKVRHLETQEIYALKVILTGEGASADTIARFHREVETTARLKHPNIVQWIDSGEENGQHYFCMEYVNGKTLEDWIHNGLDWKMGLQIIEKILQALVYAHEQGVIHRDLKPANIFITSAYEPKIGDFGLAKNLLAETPSQRLTQSGEIIGTPVYMAPEQIKGKRETVEASADIYSVGACLYQILTKKPPFEGSSIHELFYNIIAEEPLPPSSQNKILPKELDAIVLMALEKSKQNRYSSAKVFADDIRHFLNGEPLLAKSLRKRVRFTKWTTRNSSHILLGIIFLLSLSLLGIVYFWKQSEQKQQLLNEKVEQLKKEKDVLEEINKKYEEAFFYKISQTLGQPLVESLEQTKKQWITPPHETSAPEYVNFFIEQFPSSSQAKQAEILQEVCLLLQKNNTFDSSLKNVAEAFPEKPLLQIQEAQKKRSEGDLLGALHSYSQVLEELHQDPSKAQLQPQIVDLYQRRSLVQCEAGLYQEAIQDCDRSILLLKESLEESESQTIGAENSRSISPFQLRQHLYLSQVYQQRGWVRHQMQDFGGAVQDYSESLRLHPHYATWSKGTEILGVFLGNRHQTDILKNFAFSLFKSIAPSKKTSEPKK